MKFQFLFIIFKKCISQFIELNVNELTRAEWGKGNMCGDGGETTYR